MPLRIPNDPSTLHATMTERGTAVSRIRDLR